MTPDFKMSLDPMLGDENLYFFGSHDEKCWEYIGPAIKNGNSFSCIELSQVSFRYIVMCGDADAS